MKKFLRSTYLLILSSLVALPIKAAVIVDYQGETYVNNNQVQRNLIINSNTDSHYNIAIKPIDTEIRSADGRVRIPLDKFYINNNREDVYFRYNEYSNLFKNLEMNGIPHQITAKIRDYGVVPAGIYSLNFEIQATEVETGTIASSNVFNLQFVVPNIQTLTVGMEIPRIVIDASSAFEKSKKITNEVSPMIYINSNCDWSLYLNTNNLTDLPAKYYVRTISATNGINERLQERVLLEPSREILLAKGKAPANNEVLTVEYSLENKADGVVKSGNYMNRIRYILREDR